MDIKCSEQSKLIALLAYLESMGDIGHCTDIHIRFDGDGCSRLKVEFPNDNEMNKQYRDLKNQAIEARENFGDILYNHPGVECSFIFE